MAEYRLIYLKQLKLVTNAARPSLKMWSVTGAYIRAGVPYRMTSGTQVMSKTRLVKGAATDASASERDMPTSAALRAPQSLAPSPQKPQQ